MKLKEMTVLLMAERIPLAYDGPETKQQCRELAPQFLEEDEWAKNVGETVEVEQLDELVERLVAWTRARGYPLMDNPIPPYGIPLVEHKGPWRPLKA